MVHLLGRRGAQSLTDLTRRCKCRFLKFRIGSCYIHISIPSPRRCRTCFPAGDKPLALHMNLDAVQYRSIVIAPRCGGMNNSGGPASHCHITGVGPSAIIQGTYQETSITNRQRDWFVQRTHTRTARKENEKRQAGPAPIISFVPANQTRASFHWPQKKIREHHHLAVACPNQPRQSGGGRGGGQKKGRSRKRERREISPGRPGRTKGLGSR